MDFDFNLNVNFSI